MYSNGQTFSGVIKFKCLTDENKLYHKKICILLVAIFSQNKFIKYDFINHSVWN